MLNKKTIIVDKLKFTIHAIQYKTNQHYQLSVRSDDLDRMLATGVSVVSVKQAISIAKEIIMSNFEEIELEVSKRLIDFLNFEEEWNNVENFIEISE